MKFETNYIHHLNKGLLESKCRINGNSVTLEIFFEELIIKTIEIQKNKGRLFFFGNGASASFSNHMALDWSKNGGIIGYCLSDSSMLTALANDYSYDDAFLEFLKINSPNTNDLIITTSSSGNSSNIVRVLEYCKNNSLYTFGLSGLNEGNRSEILSNYSLYVPMKTYGMVECIHQVFHHMYLDKFMGIKEWDKKESQNMDSKNFKL